MRRTRRQQGFTLIELMVVVAIIGILAAIAIPNVLAYQAKARQTEAKVQLGAIYAAATTWYAEKNDYQFVTNVNELGVGFAPMGTTKYRYFYGGTGANSLLNTYSSVDAPCTNAVPTAAPTPAMAQNSFTAGAIGQMDTDPTCDEWEINDARILTNTRNDLSS